MLKNGNGFYTKNSRGIPVLDFGVALDMLDAGRRHGLSDPTIMWSLSWAEKGPRDLEMSYDVDQRRFMGAKKQIDRSAWQLKKTEERYLQEFKTLPTDMYGSYKPDFLQYFSWGGQSLGNFKTLYRGYAPMGSSNDPTKLNDNHLANIKDHYYSFANTPRPRLDFLPDNTINDRTVTGNELRLSSAMHNRDRARQKEGAK